MSTIEIDSTELTGLNLASYPANLDTAIDTIESCPGFNDETSAVGEAWQVVKRHLGLTTLNNAGVSDLQRELEEAYLVSAEIGCNPLSITDTIRYLDDKANRLRDLLDEIHNWAVFATPNAIAQRLPYIIEITAPGFSRPAA